MRPAFSEYKPRVGVIAMPTLFCAYFMYKSISDIGHLYDVFIDARKGKRSKRDVIRVQSRIENIVSDLSAQLKAGEWTTSKPHVFRVYTDKQRDVCAPPFVDRIVHRSLIRQIEPLVEKRLIYHTYACRKGKGAHKAVRSLQNMMRRAQGCFKNPHIVKTDISKYFASINQSKLLDIYKKVIPCSETVDLIKTISSGYGFDDGVGIPIGADTSQLSANFYMPPVDHYMTSTVGVGMYVRYMDDVVMVVDGKEVAAKTLSLFSKKIEEFDLKLNPKSKCSPLKNGVDFCGYRIWTTHILPRKRIIKRARKKFKKMADYYRDNEPDFKYIRPRVMSFLAYMSHCDGRKTTQHILKNFKLTRGHHDHSL